MAHVVGVTPEQLDDVGRPDAAEILREILRATSSSAPEVAPTLSPDEEVFRRVVTAAAKELGLKPEASDEIMRRVRQDLEQAQQPQEPGPAAPPVGTVVGSSRGIPYRVTGRTDLSDLLREARRGSGLSLEDVAARAVDPESGDHVIDADWLDRLERAALVPDEFPEYPQLDALVPVLGLNVAETRAAAGAQFFGLETIWAKDGRAMVTLKQEYASPENIEKAQALMHRFTPAPKRRD